MNREILRLAIPNILSNISVPLLSSVDTILMGRMSAEHIGAVGLGAIVFNFIYWNFGFLRMGTTGLTAQFFGKNDDIEISNTLSKALIIAFLVAVVIIVVQVPILHQLSIFLNVDSALQPMVNDYFYTRVWAAPATFSLYVLFGWFFGMQDAIVPLILTLIVNVSNIVLSIAFVKYYEMGVIGVALGTAIAQFIGVFFAIIFLMRKYKKYCLNLNLRVVRKLGELTAFLNINANIFVRTLCLTFAFGFFYSMSSAEGAIFLAVNVILLQFTNWMSYGIDGFAYASESLVGKYHGAQNDKKLHQAIVYSIYWGLGLAILYSMLYYFGGELLLTVFTDKAEVITASIPYLFWMGILPILGFASYIWDGVFVGFTAGVAMRNSMLISLILYLGTYYLTKEYLGIMHSLWLSLSIFLLVRGLVQTYMYYKKEKYLFK